MGSPGPGFRSKQKFLSPPIDQGEDAGRPWTPGLISLGFPEAHKAQARRARWKEQICPRVF